MATTTIVITYTPVDLSSGKGKGRPTASGFTVDGTAFGSLTAAQAAKAFTVFREAMVLAAKKCPAGVDPNTVTA